MVSCSDFIRDYSDYRDGLLPVEELAATREHLDACSSCQSYSQVVDAGIEELLSIPSIEPSEDFLGRLQHRLYDIDLEKRTARSDSSGSSAAFVLLLVLVLGIASWLPVVRQAANTVHLPPVVAGAPTDESEGLTLFTPGPLLLPKNPPGALVSTRGQSDVFAGYALGAYIAGRNASLSR
jgi:anti-sigma factor RsiW